MNSEVPTDTLPPAQNSRQEPVLVISSNAKINSEEVSESRSRDLSIIENGLFFVKEVLVREAVDPMRHTVTK